MQNSQTPNQSPLQSADQTQQNQTNPLYSTAQTDHVNSTDNNPQPKTIDRRVAELLGSTPCFTMDQLAQASGATTEETERFWRAMGFPQPHPDAKIFTPADVRALEREIQMLRSKKLDETASLSLTRALSHITDRLVLWQQEALVERLMRALELDDISARMLVIDRVMEYADHLQAQLDYSYRRQMAALLTRSEHELAHRREKGLSEDMPLERAVGFVDMVAYTRRSKDLGSRALADLVQSFEYCCRDVISANGARVVKTIGDAVMYIADDIITGAKTVSEMVEVLKRDPKMLPVRASVVWGGVVSRSGDVFGEKVNLASRLVDIAPPGTILCDHLTAAALADSADGHNYTLESLPGTEVQGLGEIAPVIMHRKFVDFSRFM